MEKKFLISVLTKQEIEGEKEELEATKKTLEEDKALQTELLETLKEDKAHYDRQNRDCGGCDEHGEGKLIELLHFGYRPSFVG